MNEALFTVVRGALLIAAATLLGFRFHGDALDAAAGLLVVTALAAAMSALFGRIGDGLRRPDVVQFAGMMVMMPLMFISAAFAPLDTMPTWMGTLAAANPVSYAIDALRGDVLGTGTVGETVAAVLAATGLWGLVTLWPRNLRRTG